MPHNVFSQSSTDEHVLFYFSFYTRPSLGTYSIFVCLFVCFFFAFLFKTNIPESKRINILRLFMYIIQFLSTNGEIFLNVSELCPHGFYYFDLLGFGIRWYNKEVSKCQRLNKVEFIFLSYKKWIDCPGLMGWCYCSKMASPWSSRHCHFLLFPRHLEERKRKWRWKMLSYQIMAHKHHFRLRLILQWLVILLQPAVGNAKSMDSGRYPHVELKLKEHHIILSIF